MKSMPFASAMLAVSLIVGTPNVAIAHVGHGDEFQAEGGINRVEVNPDTDAIFGIQVAPIEAAPDGSATVLIPATALVDADGQSLVFVQYDNFYEPVPVTLGATQGETVEVTTGLSVGEQLVTQGSLSLYAESRKTQTAAADAPDATAAPTAAAETPQPETPTVATETVETAAVPDEEGSGGLPLGVMAIAGGVVALVGGAIALFVGGRGSKRGTPRNNGGR